MIRCQVSRCCLLLMFTFGILLCCNAQADQKTIVVAKDGTGDFQVIQKAINAAPAGSLIKLKEGVFEEPILIEKPLTIEGAGWKKTTIKSRWYTLSEYAEHHPENERIKIEKMFKRAGDAPDGEEQVKILSELGKKYGPRSAITIKGTTNVVIRNIKITFPGTRRRGGYARFPAIHLENCGATFNNCVIVDSAVVGFQLTGQCNAVIKNCLIANIRESGMIIDVGSKGSARIIDCDIRNCGYAGVNVDKNSDNVMIKRCRISGAGYHGIRYDDASPTIEDNWIFDNERAAIYIDGKTAAVIRNNMFVANGIWGGGTITSLIENNTIVASAPSQKRWFGLGASFSEKSNVTIRNNIFYNNEYGLQLGIKLKADPIVPARYKVENNIFWNNRHDMSVYTLIKQTNKSTPKPEQTHVSIGSDNIQVDPQFTNVSKRDFSFMADSPAMKNGIGARPKLSLVSPWEKLKEENTINRNKKE